MAKGDMLKALMKNAGKAKVEKMLQKMTVGGSMPTDVMELKSMYGGGGVGSMMELPKAAKGMEEYRYGGSKKKKKGKKKK